MFSSVLPPSLSLWRYNVMWADCSSSDQDPPASIQMFLAAVRFFVRRFLGWHVKTPMLDWTFSSFLPAAVRTFVPIVYTSLQTLPPLTSPGLFSWRETVLSMFKVQYGVALVALFDSELVFFPQEARESPTELRGSPPLTRLRLAVDLFPPARSAS